MDDDPRVPGPPDRLTEGRAGGFLAIGEDHDRLARAVLSAGEEIDRLREARGERGSAQPHGRGPHALRQHLDRAHVRGQRREHVRAAREVDDAHPTLRARREVGGQLPLHLEPTRLDIARQHRVRRVEHQDRFRSPFVETPGLRPAGTGGEGDRDDARSEQGQPKRWKGVDRQPHVALEQRRFGELLAVAARPPRGEQPEPDGQRPEQEGDGERGHGQVQTRRERVAATRSSSMTSASAAMRSCRRIPTRSSVRTSLIGVVSSSLIRS